MKIPARRGGRAFLLPYTIFRGRIIIHKLNFIIYYKKENYKNSFQIL